MAYAGKQSVVRQWGYFQVLGQNSHLKFKKLVLMPGKATSLQYHNHRSEFWTILSGTGEAIVDGEIKSLFPDQMVWVNEGIVHQLSNTGSQPLVIHEVQQGDYLEEDDIVRLDADASVMLEHSQLDLQKTA